MKKSHLQSLSIFVALFLGLTMSSCDLVGGIFEAGAWTGIIGVLLVIGVGIWLITRLMGGGKNPD